jgi:hypothetical protein
MARGMPMTPPVRRENSLQLVPNWNSMGMPVTTPRRKLMAKILAQKRAATSYLACFCGSEERSAIVLRTTMRSARPMVSWGKR